jgi:soluble lytic murein transglycosylase-like protein
MINLNRSSFSFLLIIAIMSWEVGAKAVSNEYIDKAFNEISIEVGVPEDLLRGICWVESTHKPYLYRHADASATDHAYGICQILYSTAKDLGFEDEKCLKDFSNTPYRERIYDNCQLFGPRTNIRLAAKFLKKKLNTYDNNHFKAIAAYNAGAYKICKNDWLHIGELQTDGTFERVQFKRCINGGPINLYYINRVLRAIESDK